MFVRITSPETGQQVPAGPLTINGIYSDNATTTCQVYVDWNALKAYQKVTPVASSKQNDFSNRTFTYTPIYHVIEQGLNELIGELTCVGATPNQNISKWYSINVRGTSTVNGLQQIPSY